MSTYQNIMENRQQAFSDAVRLHATIGNEYGYDSEEAKAMVQHVREHRERMQPRVVRMEAARVDALAEDNKIMTVIYKAECAKRRHIKATPADIIVSRTHTQGTVSINTNTNGGVA